MKRWQEKWQELADRLEQLTRRERILVFGTVLILLGVVWNGLLMEPLERRQKSLQSEIQATATGLAALSDATEKIRSRGNENPDRENLLRLEQLRQEIKHLDTELGEMTLQLISPQDMSLVLEELLSRKSKLELISLEYLDVEPVAPVPVAQGTDPKGTSGLFRHGMHIELEGKYLDAIDYLGALEGLSRRLFWDDLEIEVLDYPVSRIRVTVHTLSLEEGWIGV